MGIRMIGIDHRFAGVEIREKFSFTKTQAAALMEKWKAQGKVHGIVLLSTCNRVEIYVNYDSDREDADFCGMLCLEKGLDEEVYRSFLCRRDGQEAVRHLFEMTAGLRSLIIGEDQILTQVNDALSFARENYAADKVLEVLFRQAVSTAKEVKTKAPLPKANLSAPGEAVESLKRQGMEFAGKKCLVIGNGMMGRLVAQILLAEGAYVTVTVRQYHRGIVDIPDGVWRIDYGQRYQAVADCDYVFSATSSPNLPITKEKLALCGRNTLYERNTLHERNTLYERREKLVLVDLAVPRDIEPAVKELPFVTLYGVDDFGVREMPPEMKQKLDSAYALIEQGIKDFRNWYECRDMIPILQKIAESAAEDICGRMEKSLRKLQEPQRDELASALKNSGSKVAAKMMYALRDELEADRFRECLEILEKNFTK